MEKTDIYKKLLAFQALDIKLKKDGKNPHFKSKYSTLNEVLDKVKEPLNKLGVLIIFEPQHDGLTTRLRCVESGTEVVSNMKYIGIGNAQQLLACNTYFRRGSLVSLLCLEDEDDDGNTASTPPPPPKKPELLPTSEAFKKAKQMISEGSLTVADIERKYFLSENTIKLLTNN